MTWRGGDELTSGRLNARPSRLRAAPGSGLGALGSMAGTSIGRAGKRPIWGTLGGSAPAYSFTALADAPGGGTVAGARTGVAYEVNGVAGLAGKVARLFPDPFGRYRFQWVATGGGSTPGGGGVVAPGCVCATPYTISMLSRVPSCNYQMYQSCTLQYGPAPAGVGNFKDTAGKAWTSTASFVDPISTSSFYYQLICFSNVYRLDRIFPTSVFGANSRDAGLYSWTLGDTSQYGTNSCPGSPFPGPWNMPQGRAFNGSDATCSVALSAAATQVIAP